MPVGMDWLAFVEREGSKGEVHSGRGLGTCVAPSTEVGGLWGEPEGGRTGTCVREPRV